MKNKVSNQPFVVKVQKSQKRFKKIKNPDGPDAAVGYFLLYLDITPIDETIYIPLSIASGKKPTGFVYQIEGTAQGEIRATDITCKGSGVMQVTLGTLLYAKIPKGMKATFRIQIEMRGRMQHAYTIAINRFNYKRDPSAARYEKFEQEIRTETLRMS